MVLRRAKALAHILGNLPVFMTPYERIVGHSGESPDDLFYPIEVNWKSPYRAMNSDDACGSSGTARRDGEDLRLLEGQDPERPPQDGLRGDLAKYFQFEGTFLWSFQLGSHTKLRKALPDRHSRGSRRRPSRGWPGHRHRARGLPGQHDFPARGDHHLDAAMGSAALRPEGRQEQRPKTIKRRAELRRLRGFARGCRKNPRDAARHCSSSGWSP
jgi:hypothetical protein